MKAAFGLLVALFAIANLSGGRTSHAANRAGAPQTSLRIHWLNAETAEPLPNLEFGMSFDYKIVHRTDGNPAPAAARGASATTGAEGVAAVEIRSPGPVIRIAAKD